MKGLFELRNNLFKRPGKDDLEGTTSEVNLKTEICEILEFFLDLRQDSLITNIITWFESILAKVKEKEEGYWKVKTKKDLEKEIVDLIKKEFKNYLPNYFRTSIEELDNKYEKEDEDNNLKFPFTAVLTDLKDLVTQNKKLNKLNEFPDFNTFFSEKFNEKEIPLSILPSFIFSLLMKQNYLVEKKIFSAMLRCFHQRQEVISNIYNLEIVFDLEESKIILFIKQNIEVLHGLTEKLEVF